MSFQYPLRTSITAQFNQHLQKFYKQLQYDRPSKKLSAYEQKHNDPSITYMKDLNYIILNAGHTYRQQREIVMLVLAFLSQAGWIQKKSITIKEIMEILTQFLKYVKVSLDCQQKLILTREILQDIKKIEKEKWSDFDKKISRSNLEKDVQLILKQFASNRITLNELSSPENKDLIERQKLDAKKIINLFQEMKVNGPKRISIKKLQSIANIKLSQSSIDFVKNLATAEESLERFISILISPSSQSNQIMKQFQELSNRQKDLIKPLYSQYSRLKAISKDLQEKINKSPEKGATNRTNSKELLVKAQYFQSELKKATEQKFEILQENASLKKQVQQLKEVISKIMPSEKKRRQQMSEQLMRKDIVNVAKIRQRICQSKFAQEDEDKIQLAKFEQIERKYNQSLKEIRQLKLYINHMENQQRQVKKIENNFEYPYFDSINKKGIVALSKPKQLNQVEIVRKQLEQLLNYKTKYEDKVNELTDAHQYIEDKKNQNQQIKLQIESLHMENNRLKERLSESEKNNQQNQQTKHPVYKEVYGLMKAIEQKQEQLSKARLGIEKLNLKLDHYTKRCENYAKDAINDQQQKNKLKQQYFALQSRLQKQYNQKLNQLRLNEKKLRDSYHNLQKLYQSEKKQSEIVLKQIQQSKKTSQIHRQESSKHHFFAYNKKEQEDYNVLLQEISDQRIQSNKETHLPLKANQQIAMLSKQNPKEQIIELRELLTIKDTIIQEISQRYQENFIKKEERIAALEIQIAQISGKLAIFDTRKK